MYVLGINALYHESAACLVEDAVVVAAAEEERFTRIKHAKTPSVDNPHALPLHAMRYCLETAGIDLCDVDHIAYSSAPVRRSGTPQRPKFDWTPDFTLNIRRVPEVLRLMGFAGQFTWVDHHTAHAASAYYPSPFDEAAVLTVDGIGDTNTTASYFATENRLKAAQSIPAPHSLGFLWELVSMYLGFHIYDATKIMGLAAYGDPERYYEQFKRLLHLLPGGQFRVNNELLQFWKLDYKLSTGYFGGLEKLFGVPHRTAGQPLEPCHRDISAALQRITDDLVLHLANHLFKRTGAQNLCLAGGVALNCVTNQFVLERGPFRKLYVQPAAHDAGTAIGSALFVCHNVLGQPRRPCMPTPYLGPSYSPREIERALRQAGLVFQHSNHIELEVARRLSEGSLVGFFQGRMEVGPRALGNRSLLADPRNPNMRETLNQRIKHREDFRPFAPSVLHEEASQWFHMGKESPACEYMLMAYPVVEEKRDRIPAVVHVDGTSRIQVVRQDVNRRFHHLISCFQQITGVPVVLNTSFNDTEPIVCSPEDAIHTFLRTEIDYLAIGDFLVEKEPNRHVQANSRSERVVAGARLLPEMQGHIDRVIHKHRYSSIDGIHVITDRTDYGKTDQVLPLFPEHRFFLDEWDRSSLDGSDVLEIGVGCGVLSIVAARAGARVTGLEVNPRARLFAGWNATLNGCEDRIHLREGNADVYAPVRGSCFDYIISIPPFVPPDPESEYFLHPSAKGYGLDFVERILAELDAHLSENGGAQLVTVAPGNRRQPFLLSQILDDCLQGTVRLCVNPKPGSYAAAIDWFQRTGFATEAQATEMKCLANHNGVTHLHLCAIHYEKNAPATLKIEPSHTTYENWSMPLTGFQQF